MSGFTGNRPGGIAVVCAAQFVVVLDATIVTTALPSIRTALGLTPAGLPWVLTAYTLAFGSLLVSGGKVADLRGPRRAFGAGLLIFAAGSAACASAWSPGSLIGARVVQGLGAALLAPAALALLTELSGPGPERRRAVGWWTAAAASGGASGWVLGGLLTECLGWRTVFWVNLPVAALALLAARRLLPPGERGRGSGLDWPGAVGITAMLGLLVYGLAEDRWMLPLAVIAAILLGRHLRRAPEPLLPRGLLHTRPAAGANLSALLLTATTTPAMYLATLYVQQVLRMSPARASLLFPAFNAGVIAGSLGGPAVLRRIGPRRSLLAGFAAIAAGAALFATLPASGLSGSGLSAGGSSQSGLSADGLSVSGPLIVRLLIAFVVLGAGLGLASVASTQVGTDAARPEHRGVGAGVLNSSAQLGTSLGLAALTLLGGSGFLGVSLLAGVGLAAALLIPDTPIGAQRAEVA